MKLGNLLTHHKLFFYFFVLFLIVGAVDIFNLDSILYKAICDFAAPVSGNPLCPTYYDIPIWHVYLSLAMLAALYHVHGEVRTTNRHLSSQQR